MSEDLYIDDQSAEGEVQPASPSGFSGDGKKPMVASFPGMGRLLEEGDMEKVAVAVIKLVDDQAPARKRRRAEWKCHEMWLRGIRGVQVKPLSEDRDNVELTMELGSFNQRPVMDRCDELCEKLVSHLFADPALPDAEPASDSDEDRDAAEFTTRLLTIEGAESGFNNTGVMRRAERKAGVYGSGFATFFVDPMGGGWRPMEIRAHPRALDVASATKDPETGEEARDEILTTRYVKADKTLTDKPLEAQEQWLPKFRVEVTSGEGVVLLPANCTGIADACGEVLIRWTSIGDLKAAFPDTVGKYTEDELKRLVEWEPSEGKKAFPSFLSKKDIKSGGLDPEGNVADRALACTYTLFYKGHSSYRKGAYVVVGGENMVLHRALHVGMVEGPKRGEMREECLELPTIQVRQLDDDVFDDPYGYGVIKRLGPADEVRGQTVLAWLEYLDRYAHPHFFLPIGSIVQPDQMATRDDTPIMYNPGGKPEQETIPAFPPDAKEFMDRAGAAQDSAVGLGETASGLEVPTVTSGKQADSIIQQAHVNISSIRQNAADAQERLWRVVAQLYRVFWTIPCKMGVVGDDGAYKEEEWARADLKSTRNIRIARGSFSQQTREQKQQILDVRFSQQLIDPYEYNRLTGANLQATTGTKDNPHLMRVRRQVSEWRDLDEQQLAAAMAKSQEIAAQFQQQMAEWQQLAMAAQALGQPAPEQPVPPKDPMLGINPFADKRAADDEQDIAQMRHMEIRRELAGTAYYRASEAKKALIDEAYLEVRQQAGVMSIQEQQQAQADAAAQQQEAAASAENLKAKQRTDEQGAAAQAKAAESEAQRAANAQEAEAKRDHELTKEAIKSQGSPLPTH